MCGEVDFGQGCGTVYDVATRAMLDRARDGEADDHAASVAADLTQLLRAVFFEGVKALPAGLRPPPRERALRATDAVGVRNWFERRAAAAAPSHVRKRCGVRPVSARCVTL